MKGQKLHRRGWVLTVGEVRSGIVFRQNNRNLEHKDFCRQRKIANMIELQQLTVPHQ